MEETTDVWDFIDKEAAALGASQDARWKWRQRGSVPHRYRVPILERAREQGISLDPKDFDRPPEGGARANGAESGTAAASDSDKVPAGGKVSASAGGGSEAA